MGAEYFFYVKSTATFALIFYGYIILILASVYSTYLLSLEYIPTYQVKVSKALVWIS